MKIVFVLERPSQFDAPLFRLAASDPEHQFEAWFTAQTPGGAADDPELGRAVDWGQDLLAGYRWAAFPEHGRREWLDQRLGDGPERVPPELLIVNGYTRPDYLAAARAARSAGVATALRIDSVLFPGAPRPGFARRLLIGQLLRLGFYRFLTTGSLGEAYLSACGVAKSRVGRFSYAVDHAAFAAASALARQERDHERTRLGLPAEGKVVLSLTKFSQREAPWDLLEARSRLDRPEVFWLLAGDGPLRADLERKAAERGLDRVRFPGYVPYPDLPRLYAAADIFVHPAREERWGVSVAEALACGLRVVTSDRVGAGYDLVEPGVNGGRYPAGDGAALAAELESALKFDAATVAKATAQRLRAFSLEATWRTLLEEAAPSRGAARGAG